MKIYFSADNHFTVDPPKGRVESETEWLELQRDKLKQINKIVGEDLFINAGDLLHVGKPKSASIITNMFIDELPENTIILYGNHEGLMLSARMDRALSEGSFGTLVRSKGIKWLEDDKPFVYGDFVLHGFNYEKHKTLKHVVTDPTKKNIAIGHFLSYPDKLPPFIKDAVIAQDIVKEFPEFDLIVVGDNHTTFTVNDKYLSPGSLTRRSINQDKHKPCIHSWDGERLETIYLNVKDSSECISKKHKEDAMERDLRMDAWALKTKKIVGHDLDPEEGIRQHFLQNKTRKGTQELMYTMIEAVKEEK